LQETPAIFSLTYFVSFGRPGVELSARHQEETVIQELHFLPEQVSDGQMLDYYLLML